jgi:hypothetical protein
MSVGAMGKLQCGETFMAIMNTYPIVLIVSKQKQHYCNHYVIHLKQAMLLV